MTAPDPLLQLGLFAASLAANLLSALAGGGAGALTLALGGPVAWSWLALLLLGSLAGGCLGAHLAIERGSGLVKRAFEVLALLMGDSLVLRSG